MSRNYLVALLTAVLAFGLLQFFYFYQKRSTRHTEDFQSGHFLSLPEVSGPVVFVDASDIFINRPWTHKDLLREQRRSTHDSLQTAFRRQQEERERDEPRPVNPFVIPVGGPQIDGMSDDAEQKAQKHSQDSHVNPFYLDNVGPRKSLAVPSGGTDLAVLPVEWLRTWSMNYNDFGVRFPAVESLFCLEESLRKTFAVSPEVPTEALPFLPEENVRRRAIEGARDLVKKAAPEKVFREYQWTTEKGVVWISSARVGNHGPAYCRFAVKRTPEVDPAPVPVFHGTMSSDGRTWKSLRVMGTTSVTDLQQIRPATDPFDLSPGGPWVPPSEKTEAPRSRPAEQTTLPRPVVPPPSKVLECVGRPEGSNRSDAVYPAEFPQDCTSPFDQYGRPVQTYRQGHRFLP